MEDKIVWTDPKSKVSQYFTVKDCLWLPRWNRLADDSYANDGLTDKIKHQLYLVCQAMDSVREFLNTPIIVHVTYRPVQYNQLVGGSPFSAHTKGQAMDWHPKGMACDEARAKLVPGLETRGLRMEDLPGSNWVHIDIAPVITHRYFKP
jgi:uncharacterized protein YcbK (DUF882 family)